MSISMSYRRVPEPRLYEARNDPALAERLVCEIVSDGTDLYAGVVWDGVRYLIEAAGGPAQEVCGLDTIPVIGYGVRYLTVEQVRLTAAWLGAIGFDELLASSDPADPARQRLYKMDLDHPSHVAWVRECYDDLARLFAGAAASGEAMLILRA